MKIDTNIWVLRRSWPKSEAPRQIRINGTRGTGLGFVAFVPDEMRAQYQWKAEADLSIGCFGDLFWPDYVLGVGLLYTQDMHSQSIAMQREVYWDRPALAYRENGLVQIPGVVRRDHSLQHFTMYYSIDLDGWRYRAGDAAQVSKVMPFTAALAATLRELDDQR